MIFTNSFQVHAPLVQVAEFHARSANMAAITPPPVIVRIHQAPQLLSEGDEMAFTLWIGPFPVRWRALISNVTATGFIDHQIAGPFEKWEHHHKFNPVDKTTTQVNDEIHIKLSGQPLQAMIGLGMAIGLPFLLAYRGWKTCRLLRGASY